MSKTSKVSRNPTKLLDQFVSGEDPETAFNQLIEEYGGLVYSSVLRRVRDPELAEEVTQDVFRVMADKAPTLRTHPALAAWMFNTSRLKSLHALRGEQRRNLKHAAAAKNQITQTQVEGAIDRADLAAVVGESIESLSESDRQVLLLRFFEGMKFKEIADQIGRTEGACKMHLKRATDRLSVELSNRGVTLPIATLTASLASLLTENAPAMTQIIPSGLSTLSATQTTANVAGNTLRFFKTSLLPTLIAIVITISATLWQQFKTGQLDTELSELQAKRERLLLRAGERQSDQHRRMVQEMHPIPGQKVSISETMDRLVESLASDDAVEASLPLIHITNFTTDEYVNLMVEIDAIESSAYTKSASLRAVTRLLAPDATTLAFDTMIDLGQPVSSFGFLLTRWSTHHPEAAFKWFDHHRATRDLKNWESVEIETLGVLSGTAMHTDQERALRYLEHRAPELLHMLQMPNDSRREITSAIPPQDAAFMAGLELSEQILHHQSEHLKTTNLAGQKLHQTSPKSRLQIAPNSPTERLEP